MGVMRQIPGMWQSGIGHEAVQASISTFLCQYDWIGLAHRDITAKLAKGVNAKMCIAEHLGRSCGFTKGKGGYYCGDRENGLLPVTLTMGGAFPHSDRSG